MCAKKVARTVRICSVPPVMVALLVGVLAICRKSFFTAWPEIVLMLLFLAVFPMLAYPLSIRIPQIRKKGREGQRNLAFVLSGFGYVCGWIYGAFFSPGREQVLIYSIYLISVILLVICNRLLHIRASGHGCSVTGPLVLLCYYFGMKGIAIGALLYGVIFWASIKTGRHTPAQFLLGTAVCLAAWALSWLLCSDLPL